MTPRYPVATKSKIIRHVAHSLEEAPEELRSESEHMFNTIANHKGPAVQHSADTPLSRLLTELIDRVVTKYQLTGHFEIPCWTDDGLHFIPMEITAHYTWTRGIFTRGPSWIIADDCQNRSCRTCCTPTRRATGHGPKRWNHKSRICSPNNTPLTPDAAPGRPPTMADVRSPSCAK